MLHFLLKMKCRFHMAKSPEQSRSYRSRAIQQLMRNYFLDYCSNATIHGVRYFTERRRHWTERCWWIVAIIMAVCFCGISIQNVWVKWRDSPVIMNMNEKMLPISTIPFPTITICPEVKTRKGKLDLSSLFSSDTGEEYISEVKLTRAKALAHVCAHFNEFIDAKDDFTDGSVFDVIEDIAPVFNETISTCEWHYHDISCEEWFVPILTEEGLCFAFNALNSIDVYTDNMAPEMMTVWNRPNITEWSPDNGYVNVSDKKNYPIHVYSARDSAKLTITLRSDDEDIEYVCRSLTPGYKIYFHTPSNVLRATDAFVPVNLGGGVNIAFKPKLITTSDGLRKYQPNQRQCFFNSERQLHFYRFYSEENCQAECLANYTLLQCGCVKFSMPRNVNTKICGPLKIDCYRKASQTLFEEDIIEGLSDENAKLFRRMCNCLPACTTVSYAVDTDRTKFEWRDAMKRMKNVSSPRTTSMYHLSSVSIYFQNFKIANLRREEQYTNTDFLAICGGLLGLCLGVSTLSVIEFIYYSTLRLFWLIRTWKSQNAPGPVLPTHINHISIDTSNTSR